MGYYLGIDLGTSSLKVSLSDEKGNIIDTESRSYPLIMPKLNWSEQDPDEWFEAMIQALATLNVRNGLDKVRSLSFSGQMHGLVILDKNDKVIRNAILWNDSRTAKEVDFLNTAIGKKKLIEETSNIAICGFTAPKILWVKNNEPENFERIAKIMLPKDYLAYKLSGVFASDYSDLSGTLFFNVKEKQYSSFMLNVLGIKIDQLPKIYKSYDCIGTVLPKYKHLIGLNENTKVVIVGQDPYHGVGQAHGLCFSVNDGIEFPPSLVNIFKEIERDLHKPMPQSGNLQRWANQGVLMLNATLTVRAHQAGSHQNKGWETFTDATIQALASQREHIVFMLWGSYAQKKGSVIDPQKHLVLKTVHPSPLSAFRGFIGCGHFSA